MKKKILIIILMFIIIINFGCENSKKIEGISKETKIEDKVEVLENNENEINVEIIVKQDESNFSGMPIKFSSKIINADNKELEYHWILINEDDNNGFEGFSLPDNGPLKEITNSGEDVELSLFAFVSWIEGAYSEFIVKLEVKEKGSDLVLARDQIVIENHAGIYKIKLDSKEKSQVEVESIASDSKDGMPIKFKPTLKNYKRGNELEYHWTLEKEEGTFNIEGFYVEEIGKTSEIINSGEEVELALFGIACFAKETISEFKVKLEIREKDIPNPVASKEITIENNTGVYRVKKIDEKTIEEYNSLNLSIKTDIDTYDHNSELVKGISLIPDLEEIISKNVQYHWSIDSVTEAFYSEEGAKKEIINSGEPVLFVSVADIGYSEEDKLSNTIKVTLEIEEKDSNKKLGKAELIIEDYSGIYKVKKDF